MITEWADLIHNSAGLQGLLAISAFIVTLAAVTLLDRFH